jgi:hypothetical protein
MFCACGFSITLGYHRLYSHLTFQAHWIVRLFTLIFGAGAFENSVLLWACEHRNHHKHVDHDEDPYCISKGFFHAHIGWLMFKLRPFPPFDNVADLQKDPLVMWQHRYIHWIGSLIAFVFPAIIGFVSKLRRVPAERIVLAELAETQRRFEAKLASPRLTNAASVYIASAYHRLQKMALQCAQRKAEQLEVTCKTIAELRNEIRAAGRALRLRSLHERKSA